MAYAVLLENGIVVQQIVAASPPVGWIATADKVAIGSTYSGGVFTAPAADSALAAWRAGRVATRLELARGMRAQGVLTDAETLAFVAYTLPAPIVTLLLTLPAEVQAEATLAMTGAQEFPRADPLWDALAAGAGWPEDADIDAVFGWTG